MATATDQRPDLETLAAVIARSPIIAAAHLCARHRLPAGFEPVDLAVLRWIAEEARRSNRRYLPN